MYHLCEIQRVVKFIETENKWLGPGTGEVELAFHGDRGSVWEDENVLEMMEGIVAKQCKIYLVLLNCTFKHGTTVNFMFMYFTTIKKKSYKVKRKNLIQFSFEYYNNK